jgi:hypothetical protein
MRQRGSWQRYEGGIGGVKGGWGMIFVKVEGIYIAGMNGGRVCGMELSDKIRGMNVLLGFP